MLRQIFRIVLGPESRAQTVSNACKVRIDRREFIGEDDQNEFDDQDDEAEGRKFVAEQLLEGSADPAFSFHYSGPSLFILDTRINDQVEQIDDQVDYQEHEGDDKNG